MALVRQICGNIYVLDFGELIFEGSPSEMLVSSVVREAYLGSEGFAGDPETGSRQAATHPTDGATEPV
jgi:ABC-type multidrug transport system ATPase subunit